jgi:hypothetical protein
MPESMERKKCDPAEVENAYTWQRRKWAESALLCDHRCGTDTGYKKGRLSRDFRASEIAVYMWRSWCNIDYVVDGGGEKFF